MNSKRKKRFANNNCPWSSYISLVSHLTWASLIIYLFVRPESTSTPRQLADSTPSQVADSSEWWTYDSSTETLHIRAKTVYIGEKNLKRSRLLDPYSGTRLIVNGNLESSSVSLLEPKLLSFLKHDDYYYLSGLISQKTLQGPRGERGERGDSGSQGEPGKSCENEWWRYEDGDLHVNVSNAYFSNLSTTGDIIAHGKVVTHTSFEIASD